MAAPNIVNISSLIGKTTYLTPSVTTAVVLLPNAAASGKVYKINQILAANVDAMFAKVVQLERIVPLNQAGIGIPFQ